MTNGGEGFVVACMRSRSTMLEVVVNAIRPCSTNWKKRLLTVSNAWAKSAQFIGLEAFTTLVD
jgi:hypothetical protein